MYRVSYRLYGRYDKEKMFETAEAARKFFYGYCVRSKMVTRAELRQVGES